MFNNVRAGIKPVKGRAVIFATSLDESPDAVDFKTQYVSEPVVKGTKMVANIHVYAYNFVKPEAWRCFEPRAAPDAASQQKAIDPQQSSQQAQPNPQSQPIVPGLRAAA